MTKKQEQPEPATPSAWDAYDARMDAIDARMLNMEAVATAALNRADAAPDREEHDGHAQQIAGVVAEQMAAFKHREEFEERLKHQLDRYASRDGITEMVRGVEERLDKRWAKMHGPQIDRVFTRLAAVEEASAGISDRMHAAESEQKACRRVIDRLVEWDNRLASAECGLSTAKADSGDLEERAERLAERLTKLEQQRTADNSHGSARLRTLENRFDGARAERYGARAERYTLRDEIRRIEKERTAHTEEVDQCRVQNTDGLQQVRLRLSILENVDVKQGAIDRLEAETIRSLNSLRGRVTSLENDQPSGVPSSVPAPRVETCYQPPVNDVERASRQSARFASIDPHRYRSGNIAVTVRLADRNAIRRWLKGGGHSAVPTSILDGIEGMLFRADRLARGDRIPKE